MHLGKKCSGKLRNCNLLIVFIAKISNFLFEKKWDVLYLGKTNVMPSVNITECDFSVSQALPSL